MMIPQKKIDEIRERVNIVEIVSEYVPLKKNGKNYIGICPFHPEKTPSFTVNDEKQIFYCFGCGAGGNVFTFLMKQKNLSFSEAVQSIGKYSELLTIGDYVLATKWSDGDPSDQWVVGFFTGKISEDRYMVADVEGNQFRGNGFRRVKKISAEHGRWLLEHKQDIECGGRSLWWWVRETSKLVSKVVYESQGKVNEKDNIEKK